MGSSTKPSRYAPFQTNALFRRNAVYWGLESPQSQIRGAYTILRHKRNLSGYVPKERPRGNLLAFQGLSRSPNLPATTPSAALSSEVCKVPSFARVVQANLSGFGH